MTEDQEEEGQHSDWEDNITEWQYMNQDHKRRVTQVNRVERKDIHNLGTDDNKTEGWMQIDRAREEGFESNWEHSEASDEWNAIPDTPDKYQKATISTIEESTLSFKTRLHMRNFRKTICDHGIRFYSPEDECYMCSAFTEEEAKSHLYQQEATEQVKALKLEENEAKVVKQDIKIKVMKLDN